MPVPSLVTFRYFPFSRFAGVSESPENVEEPAPPPPPPPPAISSLKIVTLKGAACCDDPADPPRIEVIIAV